MLFELVLTATVVTSTVTATPVSGCELKERLDIATVEHGGVRGTWFPPASANRVNFLLTQCVPAYRDKLFAQDKLIQALTTHTSAQQTLIENLKTELALAEEAPPDFDFGTAGLGFGLGVGAGIATSLLFLFALK